MSSFTPSSRGTGKERTEMEKGVITKPKRLEVDSETLTATYGKFTAEPFERGFGTTIGNSLRRVLLSSIQGAAVTSLRIEGVSHEFSTLPGDEGGHRGLRPQRQAAARASCTAASRGRSASTPPARGDVTGGRHQHRPARRGAQQGPAPGDAQRRRQAQGRDDRQARPRLLRRPSATRRRASRSA